MPHGELPCNGEPLARTVRHISATEMAPAGLHRSMVQFRGSDLATAGPTGWRVVVVLESARRSLSSCSNQLVARAWLGTIDVLRSHEVSFGRSPHFAAINNQMRSSFITAHFALDLSHKRLPLPKYRRRRRLRVGAWLRHATTSRLGIHRGRRLGIHRPRGGA